MWLQVLNVLTAGALFYVVSLGLFFVFGVMGVINLAHGAFITVGAYAAYVVADQAWNPWLALALAPVCGLVLGVIVERVLIRFLYERPLDAILATWGLSIILIQAITLTFGREVQFTVPPISGASDVGGLQYSTYRLFMLGLAVGLAVALALVTRYTRWGLVARAVIVNRELARGLGWNTTLINMLTFGVGAAFAAFGGAVLVPLYGLDPSIGLPWLITAFLVVLVAGVSLWGLIASAVLLAGAQTLSAFYISPIVGSLVLVLVPLVVLRFLPGGLAALHGIVPTRRAHHR